MKSLAFTSDSYPRSHSTPIATLWREQVHGRSVARPVALRTLPRTMPGQPAARPAQAAQTPPRWPLPAPRGVGAPARAPLVRRAAAACSTACAAGAALRSGPGPRTGGRRRPRTCGRAAPPPAAGAGTPAPAVPFGHLGVAPAELQAMLRRDIRRRLSELLVLGWLGRLYLLAPWVFRALFPRLFQFGLYEGEQLCFERDGLVECTLRESSVVARGVPFTFRLRLGGDARQIAEATLVSIGCDLTATRKGTPMCVKAASALGNTVNNDWTSKRLLVRTIVRTIFKELSQVGQLCKSRVDLVPLGTEVAFHPREDLFAQEGTSRKWLQKVSGYYFAQARLQDVLFLSGADNVAFCFYPAALEPLNSESPAANINPEATCCRFLSSLADIA
ncbi:unnamed protein product [Prorocentrum cordatum]|uniref:Uncharacterized protein n=1 Tax=Prorocentrum cordatum TaxID=2364126 RepID=A0ABN9VPG1_9DINO|nr:unnamed protein product [Polarella glacialis]